VRFKPPQVDAAQLNIRDAVKHLTQSYPQRYFALRWYFSDKISVYLNFWCSCIILKWQ